jgi:hypothetical protein
VSHNAAHIFGCDHLPQLMHSAPRVSLLSAAQNAGLETLEKGAEGI